MRRRGDTTIRITAETRELLEQLREHYSARYPWSRSLNDVIRVLAREDLARLAARSARSAD